MSNSNTWLTAAGCLAALLPVAAAHADSASPPPQDTLEEVVVTAQNRSQSVQDVPIAIDVVSADELRQAGFGTMNDIGQIAPVVQLNQDQGVVKVTVRGVGTNSNDESQDTSVVVNIDGEYINRPNVLGSAIFDMDRVEVLRGPQGTLYGRNSTGGAINFITRKPGESFGIDGAASYGNYGAIRIDAGVDVPIDGTAAVRVAGFYDKHDGYVDHPAFAAFGGGSSDDNDAKGVRLSLRLNPTDALSANLAFEYARREFTPQAYAATDLNATGNGPTGPGCNAPGYVRVAPAYTETLCVPSQTNFLSAVNRENFRAPLFGLGRVGHDTQAYRARVAYEFSPAATLTYVGGIRSFSGDSDSFLTLPVIYRSFNFKNEVDTQSHELRLNGTVGNVLYQVGAFYFKEHVDNESGFFLPIGPNGTFLSYFGRDITSKSKSLFGQVEVPFTDTLTAVVGARYTDNTRDAVYLNAAPFGAGPPDPALFNAGPARKNFATLAFLQRLNLASDETKATWLAGLNYKPDSRTLYYGKVSTGFKGGGFDAVGDYKPESNTAVEVGMKKNFGDKGQHLLNLSAFHYDYKDLQVSVLLDTNVGGQTFNAGKAKIWGVEAAGEFQVTDGGRLHVSANYLNAEYKELFAQFNVFCVGGCGLNGIGDLNPTTPGIQQPNFAGNRPPFSPEWILTAGYDQEFSLGSAGTLTGRISATYKSSYFTDFYNYRDGEQTAFTQTDASLDWQPVGEKVTVSAYGKNLGNKRPLTYGSFVSAGPDDIFNWQFGAPRLYGVRVGVKF